MARRGQAQEALLPPLRRGRGHAGPPVEGMARHQRLSRKNHRTLGHGASIMDLVNQYLRAVAALLPRAQRDDITAELRDIILTRIEAREAALGRKLSPDEIEQELR